LEKFAGYGFNKSHAAAYAIVAYQTAYLKANYPVEFLSAMMTNDMGTTEKLTIVLNEAKSMGVEVLPPDVNDGQALFAPSSSKEKKAIRFGLAAIKGVGGVAVESIIKARDEGEKFKNLADLCERVDTRTVNKKTLESLIKSGACDCFGDTRASMFASIERVLTRASEIAYDRARGQSSLFGLMEESAPSAKAEAAAQLPEWPQHELLAHEKELLGFYVTGHPMTPFAPLLEKYCLHNTVTAKELPPRTLTRLGGMVSGVQQGFSKKSGKPYAMITIEDLEGTASMLLMNDNYDKFRELVVQGKALLVVGEVNNDEDRPKLFPQEIMPLEDAEEIHQTGASPPKHREPHAGNTLRCPKSLRNESRSRADISLPAPARWRTRLHRDARELFRHAHAATPASGGRSLRRGHLLRQSGYIASRTPETRLGTQVRQWRRWRR